MIRFRRLVDATDGSDLTELATRANVPLVVLERLLAGGWAPSFSIEDRLCRALDDPRLFELPAWMIEALGDAPTLYVTDAPTLRVFAA